jgi:hypothetical protein
MRRDPFDNPRFFRPSVADVVLIAVVLVLATAAIIRVGRAQSREAAGPAVAKVYEGEALVETIGLDVDRVVELPGSSVRLEVKEGAIRVLASDCPQQICVNGGWIRRPRQVIACVPNKTLVTIESEEPPFLDAIVR